MTPVETARSSAWALVRAVQAWIFTLGTRRGGVQTFRTHLRAWWRLRPFRRYIVSTERSQNLSKRFRP